jgi:predicted XRE-type DNA-binding protein
LEHPITISELKRSQKLWYAVTVWLSKNILKQKDIALLNSAVGNILRHTVKDYEKAFKRE